MPIQVSVRDSRELRAAVLAIASVGKEIQAQLRAQTKRVVAPEWEKGIAERVHGRQDTAVLLRSARVQVRDTNVVLRSGAVGKFKDLTKAVEFGADQNRTKTYDSRRGSKRFKVTRHTTRQLPPKYRSGRVVYPAAKDMIPRLIALWVQTTIKTFHLALERK